MKEKFAKLLLGEDMSGSGKGISPALAISNAITNLCATVFGQLSRLEPLQSEKKAMWEREIEWLVCVGEHIVELTPSCQTFPDGTMVEVMSCRPRSDIFLNLPALRKLDNMLLEILDGFTNTEFWYVDKGRIAPGGNGAVSFQKAIRQEDKWWLPVPRFPHGGLPEDTRKQLNHRRESASQIHKAATAINSIALAEMEVPESYSETLPKDVGKSILESYSRVLESLAFNIVARIDDLLYVDDISKHSDKTSTISHRKVLVPYSVPISGTPYRTTFTTPNFSPARLGSSPARSPHLGGYGSKPSPLRGLGVRRVLANYLEGEVRV